MRQLSWNVQGLGNPWTVHHLRELVKVNKPSIVILMETWLHDTETLGIRRCFLDFNILVVNLVRRAGGLIVERVRDLWLAEKSGQVSYMDIALFAKSYVNWVCFGDFNEVLYAFEKVGMHGCNMRELNAFETSCRYYDSPIMLSQEECMNGGAQKRRFCFEHMWLRDSRVERIIEDAWLHGIKEGLGNNPAALVNGWVEDSAGICDMVSSYFKKLFATSHPPECKEEVSCLHKTLCDDDIKDLEKPVSEGEVYVAVMQMHLSKAPGPDGMTALFYQKFWKIVGPTVVNVVVLVRIKRVLPRLIDETQSVFVTGRMITDNAIVAFEVHEASQQTMYLGLPSIVGRKKKDVFQAILDKEQKKILGWKEEICQ
nr:hypothetical protein [Tanacetum cinerariifolium]